MSLISHEGVRQPSQIPIWSTSRPPPGPPEIDPRTGGTSRKEGPATGNRTPDGNRRQGPPPGGARLCHPCDPCLVWPGGLFLSAIQTRSLFEDTPAARRRLVLALYAAVAPGFVASMLFLRRGQDNFRPLAVVVALILSGALWVFVRRTPSVLDWIFPVSVGPTICCGIAYATSGATGDAYLALVGAPLACAAALFELPVVLAALSTTIATVIVSLSFQMGAGAATVGTMLLAPAAAIAGWVIYSSANQFRVTRRKLEEVAYRDHALLSNLPDVLVRTDCLGRVLDVHVPSKDGLASPREDLVGRSIHELVPGEVVESMRDAVAKAIQDDAPQKLEYASPGPRGERFYEARFVRSGPDEVTVIRRDMTDRRRAEAERRFSAALLSRMQEAVIAVDLDLERGLLDGRSGAHLRVDGGRSAREDPSRPSCNRTSPTPMPRRTRRAWRGEERITPWCASVERTGPRSPLTPMWRRSTTRAAI